VGGFLAVSPPHTTKTQTRHWLLVIFKGFSGLLLGRVGPGDVTVDGSSTDAMLRTATTCLASGVEAGYYFALGVEDLGLYR